jgi:hypothetical protein
MAKVIIENALVERVFWEGKGAAVVEKFKVQGQDRSRRWSLFFDEPHGLEEGVVVDVQGLFSDKPETYTKKDGTTGVSSNLTVNKPTVKVTGAQAPSDKVGHAAVTEVWPTVNPGGAVDESAPF